MFKMLPIIQEILKYGSSIFLIEWADKVDTHLPTTKLDIKFEYIKNYYKLKILLGIATAT